jgi:hypothetical protein
MTEVRYDLNPSKEVRSALLVATVFALIMYFALPVINVILIFGLIAGVSEMLALPYKLFGISANGYPRVSSFFWAAITFVAVFAFKLLVPKSSGAQPPIPPDPEP